MRTIEKVFETALKEAGINKNVGIHSLRHSFSTHLLERGIDLRYIQEILAPLDSEHLTGLGHKSSKTTEIYTHITNKGLKKIKSPIDYLDIDTTDKPP